jgi:hypothetical protein
MNTFQRVNVVKGTQTLEGNVRAGFVSTANSRLSEQI